MRVSVFAKEGFEKFVEAEAGPSDRFEGGAGVSEGFGEGGGLEKMMSLKAAGAEQARKLKGEASGFPGSEGLAEGVIHIAGQDDALTFFYRGFGEEPGFVEGGLDDDDLGAFSGAQIGGGFAVDGEWNAGFAVKLLPAVFREGAGVLDEVDLIASGFGEGEKEVANGLAGGLLVSIESPAKLGMGGGCFA